MIEFLYEDRHLLVVNKPAMLLTQPSGILRESLESLVKNAIKGEKENVFLEAVHRLDKPTSGIVVFAKTSKALSRLTAAVRERKIKKWYYAWVEGMLPDEEGVLEHWIVHDSHRARVVDHPDQMAKRGILHYWVKERRKGKTLVNISLETGRYHQIRVQFSAVGHPILGDEKYGSTLSYRGKGIALHHYRLSIPHPITKEILTFDAVPSPDFGMAKPAMTKEERK